MVNGGRFTKAQIPSPNLSDVYRAILYTIPTALSSAMVGNPQILGCALLVPHSRFRDGTILCKSFGASCFTTFEGSQRWAFHSPGGPSQENEETLPGRNNFTSRTQPGCRNSLVHREPFLQKFTSQRVPDTCICVHRSLISRPRNILPAGTSDKPTHLMEVNPSQDWIGPDSHPCTRRFGVLRR